MWVTYIPPCGVRWTQEVWLQYLIVRTVWLPSHDFRDSDVEFIHEEDDDGEDKMLGCLRGSPKTKKLLSGLG